MLENQKVRTDAVRLTVIDEADEMLSYGFEEQVRGIFRYIPKTSQIGIFSATMSPQVLEISKNSGRNQAVLHRGKKNETGLPRFPQVR
jgi:superfamily II DNA/RNA helicase